jgi:HK97 family phage portal protein
MTMISKREPLARRLARWLGLKDAAAPVQRAGDVGDLGSIDVWGAWRAPSDEELVKSYRGTAFACANLCAEGVASVPLRLYAVTREGDAPPRCRTRGVSSARLKALSRTPSLSARIGKAVRVDEVVDHPVIDLLERVNDELDGFSLIELTDLYMEIIGSAYWYLPRNPLGLIDSIWILEAQHVRPQRGAGGRIASYRYGWGFHEKTFAAGDVIAFHMPNLASPCHDGLSPLRAAYESVVLEEKERAHSQAILENRARPDVIVTARGEYGGLGESEAERLERRFQRKFRRGRSGGVLVISDEVDVKPLTFSPKEVQSALLHQMTKEDIANAFGVPMSLLQTKDVNRANAEAGHYQLARNAILPRCRRLEQRLSQRFCTLFDERLFVAFDSPVPADRELALRERQAHLAAGVITVDEARREIGMEPLG